MNSYIYQLWFWVGCRFRLFRQYNIERDKQMKKTRKVLEQAMTPQLKELLKDYK